MLLYLDSEDLLPQVLQVVEGRLGGDRVDEDEALPVLHIKIAHGRELFLKTRTKRSKAVAYRGTCRQFGLFL